LQLAAVLLVLAGVVILRSLFVRGFTLLTWLSATLPSNLTNILRVDVEDSETVGIEEEPTDTEATETMSEDTAISDSELLAVARERLSTGRTDDAIIMGYEAVRSRLIERLGRDAAMTHWELLRACEVDEMPKRMDALRRLTEAYERAAFSLQTSSLDTTKTALASATYLMDDTDTDSSVSTDSD
jgi:hypothetical protein